jgi:MtN3 and saliva related transmembrane protein
MDIWVEALGGIAAVLTTAAFLPQVLKTLKTRQTRDISLVMFSMMTFGIALWLIYGALIGSWPLIGSNLVTFVLAATILALKLKHG